MEMLEPQSSGVQQQLVETVADFPHRSTLRSVSLQHLKVLGWFGWLLSVLWF